MDMRKTREMAGLSQFTVAQRSGISRMRLSLAECGEIQLRQVELESIRKVLRAEIERRAAKLQTALSVMTAPGISAEVVSA